MPDPLIGTAAFWGSEQELLGTILYPEIQAAVDAGLITAADAIYAAELGLDFELLNTAAVAFAEQYTFALVSQITTTTAAALETFIADWIRSGNPLSDLYTALQEAPVFEGMFGAQRARLVAITESTRAFAEANMMLWRNAGYVEGTEWRIVGGPVCELCQMNSDAGVVAMDHPYPSGDTLPPAHPGCRCYLSPVVMRRE